MAIEIKPYAEELIPAVKLFNQRLMAGGVSYQFPEHHVSKWLPKLEGRQLFQEYFLAVENGSEVRGTFMLKHQAFSLAGEPFVMAAYQLPISEGLVNKTYASIGVQVLMSALKRQPVLYALGFGGRAESLALMLMKLGWTFETIPFFFHVEHPFRFLRNITLLRTTWARRTLANLLAFSGLGWLGIKLANRWLQRRRPRRAAAQAEVVEAFSTWADELWAACRQDYALCAVRDLETLSILYPPADRRFIRLKVSRDGKVIGWAVLLNTPMVGAKHFGNLRVGSIADCLASRKNARHVIQMAAEYLQAAGVDIIVSNQLDAAWGLALKEWGFMSGPSNFLLALSKKLLERLQPIQDKLASIHMNRGDGDGPIHL